MRRREAPRWRAGFGYEFLERPDGYPGLAKAYGLAFREPPQVMDLALTIGRSRRVRWTSSPATRRPG